MTQKSQIIDFSNMSTDEIANKYSNDEIHKQLNLRGAYANQKIRGNPFGNYKIKDDDRERNLLRSFDIEVIEPVKPKGGKRSRRIIKLFKRPKRTRKNKKSKKNRYKHRINRRKTRR